VVAHLLKRNLQYLQELHTQSQSALVTGTTPFWEVSPQLVVVTAVQKTVTHL
jgi:hypothetical protein